jgi:ABC-type polysaccharide/polyol phosphate export permease
MIGPATARERDGASLVDVLTCLTSADLQVRFGRGPWRLVKWLADPFALLGVYLALIAFVLDRPGRAPGLSLACAIVPFQLVIMTVSTCLDSIGSRRAILANMNFRRMLIPLAATLTETIAFGAALVLLAVMMVVYGVAPTASIAWLPAAVAVTFALAVALGYPAALIGLWFPDLRSFAVSATRALFFLAPSLVPLSRINGTAHTLVRFNPLGGLFEAYRDIVLYGRAPAAWTLLYPLGVAALLLAVFLPLYRREERHFAKVVL